MVQMDFRMDSMVRNMYKDQIEKVLIIEVEEMVFKIEMEEDKDIKIDSIV